LVNPTCTIFQARCRVLPESPERLDWHHVWRLQPRLRWKSEKEI